MIDGDLDLLVTVSCPISQYSPKPWVYFWVWYYVSYDILKALHLGLKKELHASNLEKYPKLMEPGHDDQQ